MDQEDTVSPNRKKKGEGKMANEAIPKSINVRKAELRRLQEEKLHLEKSIKISRVLSRERDKKVATLESENRNMQNKLANCEKREEVRSVILKGRMKRIIALESEKKSLLNALEKGINITFCMSHFSIIR